MGGRGRSSRRHHARSASADEQRIAVRRDLRQPARRSRGDAVSSADAADFAAANRWKRTRTRGGITQAERTNCRAHPAPAIADDDAYHALPRRALFDRIGMRHAVIETDASGTFVGSSFSWARRDWARFGLLFLNDGVWEGERILPKGWVDYCRRPTPRRRAATAPTGGATPAHPTTRGTVRCRVCRPTYLARGYQGQSVNIFPARRLVVVRLGLSAGRDVQPPRFSCRRFGVRRPLTLHPALNLQDMPACRERGDWRMSHAERF